jgi:hypothetical protein
MLQGLLNNTAVVSINFDPRQPQHFTAAFADSTIMQFNLFAEDPVTTVTNSPLPWVTHFEGQPTHSVNGNGNSHAEDEGEEGEGGSLMTWKNEDWAQLAQAQPAKRKEGEAERSPWAGKNPTAAYKVGKKPLTGELAHRTVRLENLADD